MLIDAHAHIVSTDRSAYPVAPLGGDLRPGSLDDPFTADRLLADLDAAGVARAIVIQRAHIYGHDNSYVLDSAARHPDRLTAVCCLDAEAAGAADVLGELVADRGAGGVRLTVPVGSPSGGLPGTDWFASPRARAVWTRAAELHIPVCLHLFRWNRTEGLHALAQLMCDVPDVDVVLDHVGNAEAEAGLDGFPGAAELLALADVPRLHVKVATLNFVRLAGATVTPAALVAYLVRHFGAARVLWGSDVTQTPGTYQDMVAQARAAVSGLDPDGAALVLGGTATALYPATVVTR